MFSERLPVPNEASSGVGVLDTVNYNYGSETGI